MTSFEKVVLKLLVAIWQSVRQTPGVATYDEDVELELEAQELINGT